jgi:hypothetical protein
MNSSAENWLYCIAAMLPSSLAVVITDNDDNHEEHRCITLKPVFWLIH